MSFLLGLTGSIGMGKSTTAAMFAEAGVPVWDADRVVHELYAPGGEAVTAVGAIFPRAVADHGISRAALRTVIAEDPSTLEKIEAIVHPLVAADRLAFIAARDAPVLLFDIPLLFETGANAWLDAVVVVTTSPARQRDRVLARGTMTEVEFEQVLARQMPDAEKRKRADYLIRSDTIETAREDVHTVLDRIRERQNA